jgi:hypothetical protein
MYLFSQNVSNYVPNIADTTSIVTVGNNMNSSDYIQYYATPPMMIVISILLIH